MDYFTLFFKIFLRLATLGMFIMSTWAITFNTVGYAMYFMLVAIFLHLEAMYHEKKEQVQA